MSLLLYGIIAESASPVLAPELQVIKASGLAAIVEPCAMQISRESATVLAYGDKIMQVHQQTTLIPIRYGSQLSDEAAVIAHLLAQQQNYRKRLEILDDGEEMGIRLLLDNADNNSLVPTHSKTGHDYLLARKKAYAIPEKAEQQGDFLNKSLAGLYRQHCAELCFFNGQRSYLLSYLVTRTNLSAFCHLANTLKENAIISGPWPPYSFAS